MRKEFTGDFSTFFSITEKQTEFAFERSKSFNEDLNCSFKHLKENFFTWLRVAFLRRIFKMYERLKEL